MTTWMKRLAGTGIMMLALLTAGTAVAGPKWKNLGDYNTGGGAKEIAVNREISEIAIDVKEGQVIINTGIMLERLTNGVIPIGWHRVVAAPGYEGERYSVVQFCHPRPWTILSPVPKIVGVSPRIIMFAKIAFTPASPCGFCRGP